MKKTRRETKIKKKYLEIFKDIDDNKKEVVMPLIDKLAFYVASTEELEEAIREEGHSIEYDNGGGQKGVRENPNSKIHRDMTKHIEAIVNKLLDLTPPAQKKSKLEELMNG